MPARVSLTLRIAAYVCGSIARLRQSSLGAWVPAKGAQLFFSFAARIFTCLLPQEGTREDYRVSLCQRSITPLPAAYD